MNAKGGILRTIAIASTIAIPAIGLYIYNFTAISPDLPLSLDPNDWGAFGNYFMLFVGIVNLIILYRISDTANSIQKGSLDRQLKADIYKDFLQRIDNHSENMIACLFDKTDIKKAAHLMLTTVENSKTDFAILLGNTHADFDLKCAELITATEAIRDNTDPVQTDTLLDSFLNKKSDVRQNLYSQISSFIV